MYKLLLCVNYPSCSLGVYDVSLVEGWKCPFCEGNLQLKIVSDIQRRDEELSDDITSNRRRFRGERV